MAGLQTTPGAAGELRTWTDTQGRTVRAKFIQREGEIVVVTDERDRTFRIPLERLRQADRDWVQSQASETQAGGVPSAAVSLRTLGIAIHTHHESQRCYPPNAIVSDGGLALLSWRVLLLESLGYPSLAAAFRYDEPWNSEHNGKLVPLMPPSFAAMRSFR